MFNLNVTQAKQSFNTDFSKGNHISPFVLSGSCFSQVQREYGRHQDATAPNYQPPVIEPLKLQSLRFNGHEETYRIFKLRFQRVMKTIDQDLQIEYLLQCLEGEALRLSMIHIDVGTASTHRTEFRVLSSAERMQSVLLDPDLAQLLLLA